MATKEQQRRQFPIMQFITLILITISILALGNFAKAVLDNHRLDAEKAMWQAKIEQELAEKERLLKQKELVASDTYQRQLAHELGLYAPDEQPLVLILPPESQDRSNIHQFDPVYREGELIEPPNWLQWWDLFFGELE